MSDQTTRFLANMHTEGSVAEQNTGVRLVLWIDDISTHALHSLTGHPFTGSTRRVRITFHHDRLQRRLTGG